MEVMEGLVKLHNGKIRFYLFSDELPPLIEIGGARAQKIAKILRDRFGSYRANGAEVIRIDPFRVLQVLVWAAASVAVEPSDDLLEALLARTPRSALNLLFELEEPGRSYTGGGPMIRYRKLRRAAKIIVDILRLEGYPV